MSAINIVEDLHRCGIALSVAAGKLRVDAPRGVLTAELRERLRAHKAELLAALAAETAPEPRSEPTPVPSIPPHVACSACLHLDGERCTVRGYNPIFPHLAMRLCGDYSELDRTKFSRRPGAERDRSDEGE